MRSAASHWLLLACTRAFGILSMWPTPGSCSVPLAVARFTYLGHVSSPAEHVQSLSHHRTSRHALPIRRRIRSLSRTGIESLEMLLDLVTMGGFTLLLTERDGRLSGRVNRGDAPAQTALWIEILRKE